MRELIFVIVLSIITIYHLRILHVENKINGVSIHSAVIFTLIIYVDIIPIMIYLGAGNYVTNSYMPMIRKITDCTVEQFVLAECSIFLFTLFFHYEYKRKNNPTTRSMYSFDEQKFQDVVSLFSIITFLVGGLAFVLYIRAFGGVSTLLSYADYFRTFRTNNADIIGNRSTLLVVPARLITVAPILIWTQLHFNKKHRVIKIIVFVISFILAVIFLLFNAGKTNIIIMVICFAIPFLQKKVKHAWTIALIAGGVMLPLLGVLDSLFAFLTTGNWYEYSTQSLSYVGQFSYVYGNVLNLSEILKISGLRFGLDFITGVLSILPGLDFTSSYEFTSQLHFGTAWTQTAGVPDDLISFGYMQFGILGVPIVAIILGAICGKVDRLARQISEKYGVFVTTLMLGSYGYLINADIGVFIKSQFQLSICLICILYSYLDIYNRHKRIRLVFRR